jgi:hypothetical protein
MPNFILGGIRNGMGVSTGNSGEPRLAICRIADLRSAQPARFQRANPIGIDATQRSCLARKKACGALVKENQFQS